MEIKVHSWINILFGLIALFSCACQEKDSLNSDEIPLLSGSKGLSQEEQLDPVSCQPCHPYHYAEWRASVHAHASEDPIFRALNQLGQMETNGALGDFCIRCHAPVAFSLKLSTDGLNLSELPDQYQGITCVYCHQISMVEGTHNNPLVWENDGVMRGGLKFPKANQAHRSAYSPHLDGDQLQSSQLCGSCHDIVTPTNIHLERTYLEWSNSLYAVSDSSQRNSCSDCHMPSRRSPDQNATAEPHHDHLMPAVDLVHNPEHGELLWSLSQRTLKEEVQGELDLTLLSEVCGEVGFNGGGDFEIYLENVSAGHRFPSGAALDRRLWAEVTALDINGDILFSSGVLSSQEPLSEAKLNDPYLWLLRDQAFDSSGQETHRFWKITSVERNTLPPSTLLSGTDQDYEEPHVLQRYRIGTDRPIYELRLRIFLRPIALELLQELVELNLLDESILLNMPTFELKSAAKTWRADDGEMTGTLSGRTLLCTPL